MPLISPELFGIISWNFDNVNKISLKIFWHLNLKAWSICVCIKCNFSKGLKFTDQVFYEKKTGLPNFQLPNMLWSWNLHWEYTLTNEVDCWRYWPDVVTVWNMFLVLSFTLVTWWGHLLSSMNVNYFCDVRHKNRRKRNQYFKLLFFQVYLHFDISN